MARPKKKIWIGVGALVSAAVIGQGVRLYNDTFINKVSFKVGSELEFKTANLSTANISHLAFNVPKIHLIQVPNTVIRSTKVSSTNKKVRRKKRVKRKDRGANTKRDIFKTLRNRFNEVAESPYVPKDFTPEVPVDVSAHHNIVQEGKLDREALTKFIADVWIEDEKIERAKRIAVRLKKVSKPKQKRKPKKLASITLKKEKVEKQDSDLKGMEKYLVNTGHDAIITLASSDFGQDRVIGYSAIKKKTMGSQGPPQIVSDVKPMPLPKKVKIPENTFQDFGALDALTKIHQPASKPEVHAKKLNNQQNSASNIKEATGNVGPKGLTTHKVKAEPAEILEVSNQSAEHTVGLVEQYKEPETPVASLYTVNRTPTKVVKPSRVKYYSLKKKLAMSTIGGPVKRSSSPKKKPSGPIGPKKPEKVATPALPKPATPPAPKVPEKKETSIAALQVPETNARFSGTIVEAFSRGAMRLAGAKIEILGTGHEIIMDESGNFEINDIRVQGVLPVIISKDGYLKRQVELKPNKRQVIELVSKNSVLLSALASGEERIEKTGFVFGQLASPVRDAVDTFKVQLRNSKGELVGQPVYLDKNGIPNSDLDMTSKRGQFLFFNVPVGTYLLSVHDAFGVERAPHLVFVGEDEGIVRKFSLGEKKLIHGKILDGSNYNLPMPSAHVQMLGSSKSILTDDRGQFVLGPVYVDCSSQNYIQIDHAEIYRSRIDFSCETSSDRNYFVFSSNYVDTIAYDADTPPDSEKGIIMGHVSFRKSVKVRLWGPEEKTRGKLDRRGESFYFDHNGILEPVLNRTSRSGNFTVINAPSGLSYVQALDKHGDTLSIWPVFLSPSTVNVYIQ